MHTLYLTFLLQGAWYAVEASRVREILRLPALTPVTEVPHYIIGMAELALDTDLTAEQREYLNVVKGSADSLLRLLNDVLDFAKIEARKLDLVPVEFRLRESLESIMKTLAV